MSNHAVVLIVGSGVAGHDGIVQRLGESVRARVVAAPDGRTALQLVAAEQPDLVLTELELPDMHAARLVRRVRCSYPFLSHMVIAPHYDSPGITEVLCSGACRCLAASDPDGIADAVADFLRTFVGFRQWDQLRGCWRQSALHFVIENDAEQISALVGYLQQHAALVRSLDETTTFHLGVALHEALRNAVEHGNLEVSNAVPEPTRSECHPDWDLDERANQRRRLVRERLQIEPYRSRRVTIVVQETARKGQYQIRDEGRGFDAAGFQYDPTDGDNIAKPWGRGLFLVRSFMDEVSWNPMGNEITMVHHRRNGAGMDIRKDISMQFKIQKSEDSLMRVDVVGDIVRGASLTDDDPLADAFGDGVYSRRMLLNLRQCKHIDSTGIGYLLSCHRRFERQGGKLVLHSAPAAVNRLFQVMRVDQLLHVAGDAVDAARLTDEEKEEVHHDEH